MILYKFKEKLETRPNFPCEKFRWILEIAKYKNEIYAQLIHQHKYKDDLFWYNSHVLVYGISICSNFKFGLDQTYYDGYHNKLSLGWVQIYWGK